MTFWPCSFKWIPFTWGILLSIRAVFSNVNIQTPFAAKLVHIVSVCVKDVVTEGFASFLTTL